MRQSRIGLALIGIALATACSGDKGTTFTANNGPIAFTRFVNAVSDSGAQDWRFVDQVDGSPTAFGLAFRAMFPGASYQLTSAGSRHLRIFQTSTDIVETQKVFFDTTFNFVAGTHYTIIAAGALRDRTAKLYILTDDYSDPGSQVSLRVFNAGAGTVDVYASATGGTSTLPSAFASALADFSATKYTNMATGDVSLRTFGAGVTAFPAMIDIVAPAGLPADRANNLTAVGGTKQAGSALTAFIFPRSVAGSKAATFNNPGVVFIVDRYPPSGF
jgi:Domain of unknown function (DUF4397)